MTQEASETTGMSMPKQGEFVWTEIASKDAGKCQAFYEAVFGWQFKHGQAAGMDYREFTAAGSDQPVGGLYQIDPQWFDGDPPPPHHMIYVAVDDVDANAEMAKELGGTVIRVMDVPNVGRMAMIQDPTGAMIATFKMQSRGGEHG